MADLAGDVRFRVKSRLAIIRFATGCLWRKAAIEVQIIRSEWFLLAGSYLVSPMMDWNESLGFSNNYKAACARCVHLDIKENLAMSSVLWLK